MELRLEGPARERLLAWLERRGYRVTARRLGWHECLLAGPTERWIGRGESAEEALEDALRQALPSRLARELLVEALAEEEPPAAVEEAPPAPAASRPHEPDGANLVREPVVLVAPERPVREERAPEPHGSPGAVLPPRLEPLLTARGPRITIAQALGELGELHAELLAEREEVAAWSPGRQRLAILAWIAWARDVQDRSGQAREVKELVHGVARELGTLSARWWPGSVRALQESAYPAECARELELEGAAAPATWGEVARAAEGALERLESREEAAGADETGWWDAEALRPAHPDPEGALHEAVRKLEEASGALGGRPRPDGRERARTDIGPTELLRLVKTLRWIRGAAGDDAAWGDAVGRLRWIVAGERFALAELVPWLDPHQRPRRSWALELGLDPEKSARRRRRREVLRAFPELGSSEDGERLRAWLREAFECPDLDANRVASLVQPCAELVLALPPDKTFSEDRKHRRKLASVQDLLRGPPEALPERGSVLAEKGDDSDEAGEAAEPARSDPAAELLADVLPRTRGRRALLVSNRADPEQDRVLQETFAFSSLEHEVASPRKLDALVERIRSKSYDLVLSATGFQNHSAAQRLDEAARRAGIPCARVYRARRLACIRALHRDLRR